MVLAEPEEEEIEVEALARSVVSDFENYVKLNKKISPEVVGAASQIDDYSKLADTVASHLAIKITEKQEMLGTLSVKERLEKAMGFMEAEISVLQVEKRIRSRVKRQMEKTQREYYLNEQMKAIQKELGEGEDGRDEAAEIEARIKKTKLSKEAREKAEAELKKLRSMSPMSAESTVVRNYLDWLLSIPWGKNSKVKQDLNFAQEVLDARSLRARQGQGPHRGVPCRAEPPEEAERARSCASSALPASARPRSASRSPGRPAASSSAWRWAACVTKQKSAVTAAPISARCPARSSSR